MEERRSRTPVIIDCDPGIDDAVALLIAARSPEIDIRLITTTSGNVDIESTTRNARGVVRMAKLDVEIAKGADRPLYAEPLYAPEIHGATGLGGHVFADEDLAPLSNRSAIEAMADLLTRAEKKLTFIAVGPLTNVVKLFLDYPHVIGKIERIVLMGGGLRNGNATPAAEFNFIADPEAAQMVFRAGVPIVMSGLDVTEVASFDTAFFSTLVERSPYGRFLDTVTRDRRKSIVASLGKDLYFPNDSVPVVYLLHPELFETESLWVEIETKGEFTKGMSIADRRIHRESKTNCTVITGVDLVGYREVMMGLLSDQ